MVLNGSLISYIMKQGFWITTNPLTINFAVGTLHPQIYQAVLPPLTRWSSALFRVGSCRSWPSWLTPPWAAETRDNTPIVLRKLGIRSSSRILIIEPSRLLVLPSILRSRLLGLQFSHRPAKARPFPLWTACGNERNRVAGYSVSIYFTRLCFSISEDSDLEGNASRFDYRPIQWESG